MSPLDEQSWLSAYGQKRTPQNPLPNVSSWPLSDRPLFIGSGWKADIGERDPLHSAITTQTLAPAVRADARWPLDRDLGFRPQMSSDPRAAIAGRSGLSFATKHLFSACLLIIRHSGKVIDPVPSRILARWGDKMDVDLQEVVEAILMGGAANQEANRKRSP